MHIFPLSINFCTDYYFHSIKNEENDQDEDYSAVMNDPEFLQHLVNSLPGVNPNSQAIRNALGALTQQGQETSEEDAGKDEKKKEGEKK